LNTYGYVGGNPLYYSDPLGLEQGDGTTIYLPTPFYIPPSTTADGTDINYTWGFPQFDGLFDSYLCKRYGMCSESNDDAESCPVSKDKAPNHPDFTPNKKKKDLQKIPWNKNKKGFPDKKGNYWEPVTDGHKGTHDPHWDVQRPDGSHTPVYPPK
jgi:hypothetical protein